MYENYKTRYGNIGTISIFHMISRIHYHMDCNKENKQTSIFGCFVDELKL